MGRGMMARTIRIRFFAGLLALGALLLGFGSFAQPGNGSKEGVILTLNGAVTPPAAQYLAREIEIASAASKELIIIEIDTPGGLMDSMKTIIKAILVSDTPVATFVSPQGARSASAGLYIMYSAHVSAMAPATNTGAATPVEVGGAPSQDSPFDEDDPGIGEQDAPDEETLRDVTNPEPTDTGAAPEEDSELRDSASPPLQDSERDVSAPLSSNDALRAKIINDSVAYIRALAEERGRNADWAEEAVRDAVSVTANEALNLGVVDFVADDIDDLLQQINGRAVVTASGEKTLDTDNIRLERIEPTLVEKILNFLADPNVAVILMSLATTGIIIEMWNPGSIFPGVVGALCLIMGLYAFQVLPFNSLGLALMGVGAIMILIEAYTPTFGLVGLAGLAVFGFGLFVVFPDGFRVSASVIGSILVIAGGFLALILFAIVGSRSHGPMIGSEAIRKREGVVDDWNGKEGWVIIEGERWRARSDRPLSPGDKVRVTEVDGLVLVVKQAKAGGLLDVLQPKEA